MFEPYRSPLQNTSYMSTNESQPFDDQDPGIARGEQNDAPENSPYWGRKAAGCLFYAKSTGNVLFGLRSGNVLEPYTWGGFGGKLDEGETPIDGLERELSEEVGYGGMDDYIGVSVYEDPDNDFEYYNYLVICENEFEPHLNSETDDYVWTQIDNPPEPLHPGLQEAMPYYVSAVKKLRGRL
ncbi:MAG: NUDIX domain-containing protein [Ignavibacteria bacterium]